MRSTATSRTSSLSLRHFSRFDFRQVEYIIDDAQKMLAVGMDVAGIAQIARIGDRAEMLVLDHF
jgi:hypothetical protein